MKAVIGAVLLAATSAHADPDLRAHVDTEPVLTLRFDDDPVNDPVDKTVTDERHLFRLGPRAALATDVRVFAEGVEPEGSVDGYAGWAAAAHYDRELAWGIHLEVDAEMMQLAPALNGMFDRGRMAKVGVALTRYFHWSSKNVAWISLGVDLARYFGDDPVVSVPQQGTTVGLRVGTTF